jgi:hypothetical protein
MMEINRIAYCVLRSVQLRNTQYAIRTMLLITLLLLTAASAFAHGGGQLQVGPVATGPYQVSVWTDPPTPRVDRDLHVTVAVGDGVTNAPVLGADVSVTIYRRGEETAVLTKPALSEDAANRLFYETDLRLADEGQYRIVVDVAGPDGSGQVDFMLTMESAVPLNWLFLLLAVGGGGWLFYLWRKRPLATTPTRPARPVRTKNKNSRRDAKTQR